MASDAPLRPGTLFGGEYEITGPLARGGMGMVYTAHARTAGHDCALKVMHPALLSDERSRERFTREADLCARIDSAHVVKVYGSGIEPETDTPWIAMELVDGDDLEKLCRARGAFPPTEVRELLTQLFDAIGAAHAVGVVHRDLKPQNVLVAAREGEPMRVKVLDFGISKVSRDEGTDTTAAVGSPLWMAPEQAHRGRLTPATDVFALALVAFRLITGRLYWMSAASGKIAIKEILLELVMRPLPTASVRAKELGLDVRFPPGFDAWFDRAIDRDPAKRFHDARAAWAALEPVLDGRGIDEPAKPAAHAAPVTDEGHATVSLGPARDSRTPPPPTRSVLRSPTPTPLPMLLEAARDERAQKRPRSMVVTAIAVLALLLVATVVVMTRHHG